MSVRSERHTKIIEIINAKNVETQEELCEHLRNLGFVVTQATICRDIKELGLVKISVDDKHYKYACIESAHSASAPKLSGIFKEIVLRIKVAENLLVIRTMSGSANTAAAFIDSLSLDCIAGCIAGDDTIFVAVDTKDHVQQVLDKLTAILD